MDHFRSLHRVVRRLAGQEFQLERHEILGFLLNVPLEHVSRDLFAVAVGIVTVREQHHVDVQPLSQEQVHPAQRRSDARGVPIKQHRNVLGVAADQLDLIHRQGRTARRDDVFNPRLVQGHHIRVALNQQDPVFLRNRGFGQVHTKQHIAFVVENALRTVEVLGDLFFFAQRAAPERNGTAGEIADREHHPALEKVPQLPVFVLGEAECKKPLRRIACFGSRRAHRIPAVRAIPNLECLQGLGTEPSTLEVAQADGLALVRVVQLFREPVLGPRV